MSTPPRRDTNKIAGIVNVACGSFVALSSLAAIYLLFVERDIQPQFVGEKFYQVTEPKFDSFVPSLLLVTLGLSLVVFGIVLIRRHIRDRRLTVGTGPRPQAAAVTAPERSAVPLALRVVPGVGYRSFVAWRYLLVYKPHVTLRIVIVLASLIAARIVMAIAGLDFVPEDRGSAGAIAGFVVDGIILIAWYLAIIRHSRLASIFFIFGIALVLNSLELDRLALHGRLPMIDLEQSRAFRQGAGVTAIAGGVVAFLAWFFGTMRAGFTFFTTVPIGGVWIGTAALVLVLAVMSGFETDLRDKILGSNAHIQVTKEDGDFVEWREVKKKIDNIPGVVASTPYAVSEVVIAANNNGMPVIIKGIDPATVAKVTDLVNDLEDKDAMRRLEPLIDLGKDRTTVDPAAHKTAVDPPPDDMVTGGDPIDFSGDQPPAPPPDPGSGSGSSGSSSGSGSSGAGSGTGSGSSSAKRDLFGGEAGKLLGTDVEDEVLDRLDSDLIKWMVGYDDGPIVHIVDSEPTLSRRTQALPGILVGRELVKQTHLYTGEEVRVVSPLSDPSNPDATGTPIPFNRDYRVAGVFFTGMYEYDLKFVYVTLDSLQDFLDRGDAVDGIEIRLESDDDTEAYVPVSATKPGLIREALGPGYRVVDWRELNRSLFSALKLEKIAMFLVLGIVILVASFSIIGNLIMVVVEKQREIALLKTLGASDVGVMQLFAVQGMIIGLIGTALGITTGLVGCLLMEKFGLPLNPDVYYIDRLPIHVDPQSVFAAAITGVLISIGATLYPALLAARVRPAIGMRH